MIRESSHWGSRTSEGSVRIRWLRPRPGWVYFEAKGVRQVGGAVASFDILVDCDMVIGLSYVVLTKCQNAENSC